MSEHEDRVTRLSERFGLIRKALEELTDSDTAFAAATVAYLEVVDYLAMGGLEEVLKNPTKERAVEMHSAVRMALKFYHRQLCEYLEVNQDEAVKRSASFKEIVDDICKERG